jgi:hypothetical protein
MVEDIRKEFRAEQAELNCPTEEERCGYVDGTLAKVDPQRNLAIENHLLGTIGHRPCILCKRDVWELCEVLGIIPEKLVQDLLKKETPNPHFISLLRDNRKDVRIKAAEAMQKCGKAMQKRGNQPHVRWLRPLLNDDKWEVLGNAAILIGDFGGPFDVRLLEPLLDDENQEVRRLADIAMEKLGIYIKYRIGKMGKVEQIYQDIKNLAVQNLDPLKMWAVHTHLASKRTIAGVPIEQPWQLAVNGGNLVNIINIGGVNSQDFDEDLRKEMNSENEYTLLVFDKNLAFALCVSPASGERLALRAVAYNPSKPQYGFLSGIKVIIIDESGNRLTQYTSEAGRVDFGDRKPGLYAIRLEKDDFTKHIIVNLEENNDV